MSEVEQIREALEFGPPYSDDSLSAHEEACEKVAAALALLDGVTGLARDGDVVLSAEQAEGRRLMREVDVDRLSRIELAALNFELAEQVGDPWQISACRRALSEALGERQPDGEQP